MQQQKQLLKGIESLTEQEKLDFFKIEELETRLEMAAGSPVDDPDRDPRIPPDVPTNPSCWHC